MSNDRNKYIINGRFDYANKKMLVIKIGNKASCVMSEEEYENFLLMEKSKEIKKNRKYIEKYRKLA